MTGIIIGIVATVIIVMIPLIYVKFRAPVKIFPKKVAIVLQPENMKTTFHVQNRTTKMLFDVWIKVALENCDMAFRHIKIYLGDGKESSEKVSGVSEDYYSARLDGTDNKGKGLIYFILCKLAPKIPQSFTIEVASKASVDEAKKPQMLLGVARSSREPVKLLELGDEISYPFVSPKDFRLRRVFLNIRKE